MAVSFMRSGAAIVTEEKRTWRCVDSVIHAEEFADYNNLGTHNQQETPISQPNQMF